jgi:hypothetical protein
MGYAIAQLGPLFRSLPVLGDSLISLVGDDRFQHNTSD